MNNMEFILSKIDSNLENFTDRFPAEQSIEYVYPAKECVSWTEGFWTGMLWLAYEITKDEKYEKIATHHTDIFKYRIENRIATDTHDLGFLYTLSCVADYKITGSEIAKNTALNAADLLIERYKPVGEFIQAWGSLDDVNNYRLIIDCLLNLPLLYWATEVTGITKYKDIAARHLKTALSVVIRDDFTTHHTYFFDPVSGKPTKGVTAQGYSDTSCWARGQAWGIYGTALSYHYTKDETLIPIYKNLTQCFISRLPSDYIPYWDMVFTDGDEPRDTSAAAIAICGIFEMNKYINEPKYVEVADAMLTSLSENYTTKDMPYSNGILKDGMYAKPYGDKPECNIWGDYYYMEALMRKENRDWRIYW